MEFVIYSSMAVFFYGLFYWFTRDIINPAGVFLAIWLISAAFSLLYLSDLQQRWSPMMHTVVISSGISFALGALIFYPKSRIPLRPKSPTTNTFRLISRILFIFAFFCFMVEWYKNGFSITLISASMDGADAKGGKEGIPFVHYGTILLPLCTILAFFEAFCDGLSWYTAIVIFFGVVLYSFGIGLSRGDIFMYAGGFMFMLSRFRRISIKSILKLLAFLILVAVGLMMLRISNETSAVYTTTDNPFISIFYSYIALNFENLQQLINANIGYNPAGNATFKALWTTLGMKGRLRIVEYDTIEIFNARTYLYPFYHDYKLAGCLVFPFLLGFFIGLLYKVAAYSKNKYYTIPLSLLQKPILFAFFGNYFFGEMVLIWPLAIGTIIAWVCNIKLVNISRQTR